MDTTATQEAPKIGEWKGGWLLVRASWSTLRMDKEMILLPVYSALAAFGLFIIIGAIAWFSGAIRYNGLDLASNSAVEPLEFVSPWLDVLFLFLYYFSAILTTNFFTAALVAAALRRFEGGDPTIKYGIGKAMERFWSITQFSLLSSSVGTVLQILGERLPLAGRIATYIAGAAWSIVTVFAIPVIIASDRPIGPVQAVRQSADVFKKVWAKDFTGGIRMELIFSMAVIPLVVLMIISVIMAIMVDFATLFITLPIIVALLVLIASISSALNGIFHAALYRYAATGESPAQFDKNLLRAAFRPNKKWFA